MFNGLSSLFKSLLVVQSVHLILIIVGFGRLFLNSTDFSRTGCECFGWYLNRFRELIRFAECGVSFSGANSFLNGSHDE